MDEQDWNDKDLMSIHHSSEIKECVSAGGLLREPTGYETAISRYGVLVILASHPPPGAMWIGKASLLVIRFSMN